MKGIALQETSGCLGAGRTVGFDSCGSSEHDANRRFARCAAQSPSLGNGAPIAMGIFDTFSRRQKIQREEVPDVFVYDKLPHELRVQICHVWRDAIGIPKRDDLRVEGVYNAIHKTLAREYGVFKLADGTSAQSMVWQFFLNEPSCERALDVVECAFLLIMTSCQDYYYRLYAEPTIDAKDAIEELNARFLQHGIGYRFESGKIIRIDSEFIHAEVVKPVLTLLADSTYKGANDEFLRAHEHYRHGRTKECLAECLKAFESTMKSICTKRKWLFAPTDTAKPLLEICFTNGLIPTFMQSHFSSLRSGLESGVPTVRNKLGGHGQGPQPVKVPPYYAAYLLHLTATTIHLLISAEKDLP